MYIEFLHWNVCFVTFIHVDYRLFKSVRVEKMYKSCFIVIFVKCFLYIFFSYLKVSHVFKKPKFEIIFDTMKFNKPSLCIHILYYMFK